MPKYKNMKTLKKNNPLMYKIMLDINEIYTKHVIEKIPLKSGNNVFLGVEFQVGIMHYHFSIKVDKGKIKHNFQRHGKRRTWINSSVSQLRKLITLAN